MMAHRCQANLRCLRAEVQQRWPAEERVQRRWPQELNIIKLMVAQAMPGSAYLRLPQQRAICFSTSCTVVKGAVSSDQTTELNVRSSGHLQTAYLCSMLSGLLLKAGAHGAVSTLGTNVDSCRRHHCSHVNATSRSDKTGLSNPARVAHYLGARTVYRSGVGKCLTPSKTSSVCHLLEHVSWCNIAYQLCHDCESAW